MLLYCILDTEEMLELACVVMKGGSALILVRGITSHKTNICINLY